MFLKPSPGFKLTLDNVDYRQNVHYQTEEHQNIDRHYVTGNATANRVSGNHLSLLAPLKGVTDLENGKCVPNYIEQKAQRDNYINLVQRILAYTILCLDFCKNVVPHRYSLETAKSTNSVSNHSIDAS